jgi:hypothetical protein
MAIKVNETVKFLFLTKFDLKYKFLLAGGISIPRAK